jgi:hypothetical protein
MTLEVSIDEAAKKGTEKFSEELNTVARCLVEIERLRNLNIEKDKVISEIEKHAGANHQKEISKVTYERDLKFKFFEEEIVKLTQQFRDMELENLRLKEKSENQVDSFYDIYHQSEYIF